MAAPHEADPIEDIIAREMAILTFQKVTAIAEVQRGHSRRLANIETKLEDIEDKVDRTDRRVATIERRVTTIEGKVATIERKVTTIEGTLNDHSVLLHQILARLPEPV